ncbi:hypothetical protein FBU30_005924 [Linnemannia zychae]|nr:hypothetical protein FBU30_005924 [Linnemannia zychae]
MNRPTPCQNRLRWVAWILAYLSAYGPPLVEWILNGKDSVWYEFIGWGIILTFVFAFIFHVYEGKGPKGHLVNGILLGSLANIGILIYSSYRKFQASTTLGNEIDILKEKNSFYTTTIVGSLSAASLIVQWLDNYTIDEVTNVGYFRTGR